MRELINIDARPPGGRHPAPMRDVSYRAFITYEVARRRRRRRGSEMLVEHAVQAAGFVLIPGDAVLDLLGCVAEEVVRLALHGA